MTDRTYPRGLVLIIILCTIFVTLSQSKARGDIRVIDDVVIRVVPEGAEIHINFNLLLQYVNHTPVDTGDRLQVQLRPLTTPRGDIDLASRQTVTWQPSKAVPISEVIYEELGPLRPIVILIFKKRVKFKVHGGTDNRSVVITLSSLEHEQPDSAIIPKKKGEPVRKEDLSNPYALNLITSPKPIDPATVPGIESLEEYRIYTISFEKNGIVYHRLRVGFFPTYKAASDVLSTIKKRFTDAWVTRVSKKERKRAAKAKKIPAPTPVAVAPEKPAEVTPIPTPIPQTPKKPIEEAQKKPVKKVTEGEGLPLVKKEEPSDLYAISLISSPKPIDQSTFPGIKGLDNYQLYTTRFKKNGKVWHRLRLGFFPTEKTAKEVLSQLIKKFPQAWVTIVTIEERRQAEEEKIISTLIPPPAPPALPPPTPTPPPAAPSLPQKPAETKPDAPETGKEEIKVPAAISDERLADLMEEAKQTMTGGEYRRAIQIYTKVLQYPDHKYRQEAQELLGLARERNGQIAHARAEYEEYLRLYPEGEGAKRVRQRLAGLLTASVKPREKLRKAKKTKEEKVWRKEFYGSFSHFYNRDVSTTDLLGETVNQNNMTTDLDFNARLKSTQFDLGSSFIGGFEKDFEGNSRDEFTVNQLYLYGRSLRRNASLRVGRQSQSSSGILGRFDGSLLSVQLFPAVRLNGVGGFPVDVDTSKGPNTDKHFYGVSLDLGTFAERWDINTYYIEQEVDGITDRQAVGGEIRYFSSMGSLFTLVDYDLSYEELNTILFTGNLILSDGSTFNLSADYRTSPILTTSNALVGQGVDSVSDLLDRGASEDEVRKQAQAVTTNSWSATLGATRPLSEKLQISGDVTVAEIEDTGQSGSGVFTTVEAIPGTGIESFYNLQFIGSSLIKEGDIAILGFRYQNTSSSDTYSANLNTRYPVNRAFRINPRFRVDYRMNDEDGGEQLTTAPGLRIDYRFRRRVRIELEGGTEWTTDKLGDQTDRTFGYFLFLGYRVDI
jgi:tetratricopeptide (TPR) repeat protein